MASKAARPWNGLGRSREAVKLGRALSESGDEVFCLVGEVMEMEKSGSMEVWWTPTVRMGFRGRFVWRWFVSSLRVCHQYGLSLQWVQMINSTEND